MYEKDGSSAGILEADRQQGRQTGSGGDDGRTAICTSEKCSSSARSQTKGDLNVGLSQFHVWLACGAILLLVFDCLACQTTHLAGFWANLFRVLPAFVTLAAILAYTRWSALEQFEEVCRIAILALATMYGLSVFTQLCGRSGMALIDSSLAALDARIGFSTPAVVAWISHVPSLRLLFAASYESLPILILLSLFVPILCGHKEAAWRYLLAVTVACLVAAVISALWPALGPAAHYGFAPNKLQAGILGYLLRLRSADSMVMNSRLAGIVSFPSFHVVLAILPVFALWRIRWLRWVLCPVALVICLSTVTTGWHYGIDVIGGLADTAVAQWIATVLVRAAEQKRSDSDLNLNNDPCLTGVSVCAR